MPTTTMLPFHQNLKITKCPQKYNLVNHGEIQNQRSRSTVHVDPTHRVHLLDSSSSIELRKPRKTLANLPSRLNYSPSFPSLNTFNPFLSNLMLKKCISNTQGLETHVKLLTLHTCMSPRAPKFKKGYIRDLKHEGGLDLK